MKARNLLPWLLILIGAVLIAAPMLFPLVLAPPPSYPWTSEIYCANGPITQQADGKYYLWSFVMSEKGVPLSIVKVTFIGTDYIMQFEGSQSYDQFDLYLYKCSVVPPEYKVNYEVTYYVEDVEGRSCSVSTTVYFIPPWTEIPTAVTPNGYFTINGEQATSKAAMLVDSPELDLTFIPTENPEYIIQVNVEVYKDGQLIDTVQLSKLPDGSWHGSYTLPSPGVYTLEGNVLTEEQTIRLMNITLNCATGRRLYGTYLQIAGAALTIVGAVMLIKKK
ncbi:hypothetical protein DRO69_06065 [Candidatus Bathyarchaeota archaeon]|nr:MAG: hypothetical protein DRO69_06065 [Candidatus Bathyarchaeota archaeon]